MTPDLMHPDLAPAEQVPASQKCQAIRELFTLQGIHASGSEIRAALGRQGIAVSLPEIYAVRNSLQHQGSATPKELRDPHSMAPEPDLTAESSELLRVREWAYEVGGPERLKELCDRVLGQRGQ